MPKRILVAIMTVLLCVTSVVEDLASTRTIAPGVTYSAILRGDGPWEIRVVRLQRDEPTVHLDAGVGGGTVRGFAGVSRIVEAISRPEAYAVAAVNGDFYAMSGPTAGLTRGPSVAGAELISTGPTRNAFYVTADGTPRIGRLEVSVSLTTPAGEVPVGAVNRPRPEDGLALYTDRWGWPVTGPALVVAAEGLPLGSEGQWAGQVTEVVAAGASREVGAGEIVIAGALAGVSAGDAAKVTIQTAGVAEPVVAAVGGGPILVKDGLIVVEDSANAAVHPRTAVGFSDDEIVLVTVDGRQTGWSVGMAMHPLAALMVELGCRQAINVDGGGSTTAWVRGEIVNRPSDGRERSVANALLVLSGAPTGPLARIEVDLAGITALPGARVPVEVRLLDEWYNPVAIEATELVVETVDGPVSATWDGEALLIGNSEGEGTLRLRHRTSAAAGAAMPMRIVSSVAGILVEPAEEIMAEGDEVGLHAKGLTAEGESVWIPEDRLAWRAEGEGVASLGGGVFKALTPGVRAQAVAQLGEIAGSAALLVAGEETVEDFAGAELELVVTHVPEDDTVTASAEVVDEAGRFCRLSYDLGGPAGTRAAYLRLGRDVGRLARAHGETAPWLRAQIVDGNGTPHRVTLASALTPGDEWQRLTARLPDGLKAPLTLHSIYVVATAGKVSAGSVDIDTVRVTRLPE